MAHKDIFVTKDFPTTAGSKMLAGYRSPFDATVVTAWPRPAVTLGKLNCDEFAMGSSNENSAPSQTGPRRIRCRCKTPGTPAASPAARPAPARSAVAARLMPASTGTDTGGSIRQPASFCGITGIKPTYGRASRYGMVAFASSLDQAGPMARSAEDCAPAAQRHVWPRPRPRLHLAGRAREDFSAQLERVTGGLRIGVPSEFFGPTAWPRRPRCHRGRAGRIRKTGRQAGPRSRCRAPSCRYRSTTSSRPPRHPAT
jgi:aspartyl-tRNA(Asn)/glutamyl-tRNA(Gln) amidotransferase subunit A